MKQAQVRLLLATDFPYLSLLVIILALLSFTSKDTGTVLQYDRAAIAAGEFWRLITAHWSHWSFEHFLWCGIIFVTLGAICERLNRTGFILSVTLSAVTIPLFCWFAAPGMHFYRGLSGLCSSVFIVASLQMMQKAHTDHDLPGIILPATAVFFFISKTLLEFRTGQALFVHATDMFTPVPLAHLAGALTGLIIFIITGPQEQLRGEVPLTHRNNKKAA